MARAGPNKRMRFEGEASPGAKVTHSVQRGGKNIRLRKPSINVDLPSNYFFTDWYYPQTIFEFGQNSMAVLDVAFLARTAMATAHGVRE